MTLRNLLAHFGDAIEAGLRDAERAPSSTLRSGWGRPRVHEKAAAG